MKNLIITILVIISMSLTVKISAKELTPRQILYSVKKNNPDLKEIKILIDESRFDQEKNYIKKALYTYGLKGTVYKVKDNISIDFFCKGLNENETVLLYHIGCLDDFQTRIMVINKCFQKNVNLITDCSLLYSSCSKLGYKVQVLGRDEDAQVVLAK